MSVKAMDKVLSRWFLSSEFRQRMNEDPDTTLLEFDLTTDEQERLANTLCRKRRKARKAAGLKNRVSTKRVNYTPPNKIRFVSPYNYKFNFSNN